MGTAFLFTRVFLPSSKVLSFLVIALGAAFSVQADQRTPRTWQLKDALLSARTVDPLYRAAQAAFDATMGESRVAGTAYYPQMKLGSSQLETEGGTQRYSVSVIQPLISADRWATLKEVRPKAQLAEANLFIKESELARRVFDTTAELISNREGFELTRTKIQALELQQKAAKRQFDLGQGTITDVRDAEVRLLQAKGELVRLRGILSSAEKKYASITGKPPPGGRLPVEGSFTSAMQQALVRLSRIVGDGDQWLSQNPDVRAADIQLRLAELAVEKAKSAWIPEVNLTHTYSRAGSNNSSFTGVSMSMPVIAGNFINMDTLGAAARQQSEVAADKRRTALLEADRLKTQVEAGASEVVMRMATVEAAALSLDATEKSYRGGVRTVLDVLNGIEQLATVKADYVKAVLEVASSALTLRLVQGYGPPDALAEVEQWLPIQ